MQLDFTFARLLSFILLVSSGNSRAMEPQSQNDYTARAVQLVSDHKFALAATTAACAFGVYKIITRAPAIRHPITIVTKNPVMHLQCTPGYVQNFDVSKLKISSATHACAWAQLKTIDVSNFLEKGRVFLVEGKKNKNIIITLIKIASTQNDFDMLETAVHQQEKAISLYSKYKQGSVADALVDCVIEYPKAVVCNCSKPVLEVLKKNE